MTELAINQHSDLDEVNRQLEADQRALEQRAALIEFEAKRRRTAEHEELVKQCRAAKDEHERIHLETEDAQRAAIHSQNQVKTAQFYLDVAKEQRPKPGNYPTSIEIHDWREDVMTKERELSAAMQQDAIAWEKCGLLQHQRREAQRKFADLAEREHLLRMELGQRPTIRNPVTSFVMKSAH